MKIQSQLRRFIFFLLDLVLLCSVSVLSSCSDNHHENKTDIGPKPFEGMALGSNREEIVNQIHSPHVDYYNDGNIQVKYQRENGVQWMGKYLYFEHDKLKNICYHASTSYNGVDYNEYFNAVATPLHDRFVYADEGDGLISAVGSNYAILMKTEFYDGSHHITLFCGDSKDCSILDKTIIQYHDSLNQVYETQKIIETQQIINEKLNHILKVLDDVNRASSWESKSILAKGVNDEYRYLEQNQKYMTIEQKEYYEVLKKYQSDVSWYDSMNDRKRIKRRRY